MLTVVHGEAEPNEATAFNERSLAGTDYVYGNAYPGAGTRDGGRYGGDG